MGLGAFKEYGDASGGSRVDAEGSFRDPGGSGGHLWDIWEGRIPEGFCGARDMMGVVVRAPMGLNWAEGHDGSYRRKEEMALRLGTAPEALIPGLIG